MVSTKIVRATQIAMLEIQKAARKQAKDLNARMDNIQTKLNAHAVMFAQHARLEAAKRPPLSKNKDSQT